MPFKQYQFSKSVATSTVPKQSKLASITPVTSWHLLQARRSVLESGTSS